MRFHHAGRTRRRAGRGQRDVKLRDIRKRIALRGEPQRRVCTMLATTPTATLSELIAYLDGLSGRAPLDELIENLARTEVDPAALAQHVRFSAQGYTQPEPREPGITCWCCVGRTDSAARFTTITDRAARSESCEEWPRRRNSRWRRTAMSTPSDPAIFSQTACAAARTPISIRSRTSRRETLTWWRCTSVPRP